MFGIVIARKLDNGEFVGIYSKDEERALLRSDLRLTVSDLCSIAGLEYIVENNDLESNMSNLKRTIQVLESSEEPLDSPIISKFVDRVKPKILRDILKDLEKNKIEEMKQSIIKYKEDNNSITSLAVTINGISFPLKMLKGIYEELGI